MNGAQALELSSLYIGLDEYITINLYEGSVFYE